VALKINKIKLKRGDCLIKVIGNSNCSRCEITKQILINKGIDFEYGLLSDLPEEKQKELLKKARLKAQLNMPLIFKDDEIIDIKEII